ncbi:MAG: sodium ion-translocating decarboxylase subunit beta [Clostridiales bacterium]|jgi:oxaloacetate decarboxylase beta subunit|nr:sodium ion-translocating decarboxylase subunit beta [Clostridiales bacterium]
MVIMIAVGALLIFLAIRYKMEPALLLPMGFGAILVNLPYTGVLTQGDEVGIITWLYENGISNGEVFPLLLFIGIGAMIDFSPLLTNPKMLFFGAAAQVGIFLTVILAVLMGFALKDAASIGIIGAADGPTSILVAVKLKSAYTAQIIIAAYSYMALVPIIQPAAIKLVTTKAERAIVMPYTARKVSKTVKILFPILVTVVAGLIAPGSVALVGCLMFGNLLKECTVLDSLSETAQKVLANLITLLLGLAIAAQMTAANILALDTLLILVLGLLAFTLDTMGGVLFAKLINVFLPKGKKLNPMVGAAGISAFPMSARVVQKLGLEANPDNHLLMHAVGANVAGQIASVIAGGVVLALMLPV